MQAMIQQQGQLSLQVHSQARLAGFPALAPSVRPVKALRSGQTQIRQRSQQAVRATESGQDFDSFLGTLADKYEKSPNKTAISAWTVGIAFGVLFSEWMIHRPGLNVLLGFPVQLLGLLSLPWLGVRWYVDKKAKPQEDFSDAAKSVLKQLPGLDK